MPRPLGTGFPPMGVHPHDAGKPMSRRRSIPDCPTDQRLNTRARADIVHAPSWGGTEPPHVTGVWRGGFSNSVFAGILRGQSVMLSDCTTIWWKKLHSDGPNVMSQDDMSPAPQLDGQEADDVKCLLQLGVNAHNAGTLDDAAAFYRTVLRLEPENYDALRLLGYVYSSHGHRDESVTLHRRAVRISDDDPQLLLFLAHNLYGQDGAEEAIV